MIHLSHAFTSIISVSMLDGTQSCVTISFGTLAHNTVAKVIYFSLTLHPEVVWEDCLVRQLNGGVPSCGSRFCLPSSLHPPAACKPSHPSPTPIRRVSVVPSPLPGANCVHLIPQSYPCHLHLWFASKGLFASRSSQIVVQRSSFSLRFLGTSASSPPYFSVPSPKRPYMFVLCRAFPFDDEGKSFEYHYHPSSISARVSNNSCSLSHLHQTHLYYRNLTR